MAEEIRSVYQFDFVHDGQKVFRELLSAMANPGQIRKIGEQAESSKEIMHRCWRWDARFWTMKRRCMWRRTPGCRRNCTT